MNPGTGTVAHTRSPAPRAPASSFPGAPGRGRRRRCGCAADTGRLQRYRRWPLVYDAPRVDDGGRRMAGGDEDGAKKVTAPEVSIARLPSIGSKIFGRRADAAWLDDCWDEGANVASIVAFGGVGKSALVWDWLRGMQRDNWRGAERVFGWSFYSQGTTDRTTSADEFISAALRRFGDAAPNAGSPWDKGERLAGLIRKRRVLLVLDGVEPLQWGPG